MSDNTQENILLKSLNYFLRKVLYAAEHEGDWSIESIEQGIGWALFCEKAIERPGSIHTVSMYLSTKPFTVNYTIEDMKNLRKLLLSYLFINQLLPVDLFHSLYDISVRELGEFTTKEIVTTSVNKINSLKKINVILCDKKYEKIYNEFKIRMLLEATSTNSIPLTSLNNLMIKDHSLEILLELISKLTDFEKNKIYLCLGEWLKSELEVENVLIVRQLSFLSQTQLNFLCNKFPGLHSKLLIVVNSIGNSLSKINYEEHENYNTLILLFQNFLKCLDLCEPTKNAFAIWLTTKEGHFWHNIYAQVVKSSE